MRDESYIDRCLMGMGTAIQAMDPGQRQVLASSVELMRCLEREVMSDASSTLICPDDIGMIRATQASEVVEFTLTPGETVSNVILPALGLKYWVTLGLASGNYGGQYSIFIQRSGAIVGQFGQATFEPDTANARAAVSPCICVGAIQTLTLSLRPTAAFGPGPDTFSLQVFRDFSGPTSAKRGTSCGTGC